MTRTAAPSLALAFLLWLLVAALLAGVDYGIARDIGSHLATFGNRTIYACMGASAVTFALASITGLALIAATGEIGGLAARARDLGFFWLLMLLSLAATLVSYLAHKVGYLA